MAEENEDQWLYGDSVEEKESLPKEPDLQTQEENAPFDNQEDSYSQNEQFDLNHKNLTDDAEKVLEDSRDGMNEENFETNSQLIKDDENLENQEETKENGTSENQNNQDDGEVNSDSESDDDVHVVIGDIKSTPAQYSTLNLKRGGLLSSGVVPDKLKQQPGKFSIDEFESIGSINGIPAHEYNLDTLEDKPWRQPGADITDYFNYGFNEETWRAYCERQKRMRSESGVGLILNTGNNTGAPATTGNPGLGRVPQVTITNYNSKYSGITGPKRAGPPPGRKMAGTIDVIGATGTASRRNLDKSPPKENVIQVMTADRREYSRKPPNPSFPDMSVPPPMPPPPPQVVPSIVPPAFDMPPPGYPEPAPYFMPEPDPYYNSYEPTQDRQWGNDPTWQPTNIANIPLTGSIMKESSKSLSAMIPPAMPMMPSDMRDRHHDRDRGRDRDRDYEMSSRDRERDRDRDRGDRERDKESAMRDRDREESSAKDDDRDRERSRSVYKHKDRHRHRSRSRSRRHKSRSRSPSRRKKKSRRSDKEKSKEESE